MNDNFYARPELYGVFPEAYASEVVVGNNSGESDDNGGKMDESSSPIQKEDSDVSDESSHEVDIKEVKSPPKKKDPNRRKRPLLYECTLCLFKTTDDNTLKFHMIDHLNGPDAETFIDESFIADCYRCFFCPYTSTTKGVFSSHLKKKHSDSRSLRSESHLDSAVKQESDYTSNDSDSSIEANHSGRNSLRTKNIKKSFRCSSCNYKAEHEYLLAEHELTHTRTTASSCHFCEYTSISPTSLRSHIIEIHGEENLLSVQSSGSKKSRGSRDFHKKRWKHTNGKFSCSYCPYRSCSNQRIRRHERIHTGEKPFECSYCGYKCNQSAYLTVHMRMHTGEKPFKCKLCSYSTTNSRTLQLHKRSHGSASHSDKSPIRKDLKNPESPVHKMRKRVVDLKDSEETSNGLINQNRTSSRKKQSKNSVYSATNEDPNSELESNKSNYQCSFCDYKCVTFVELSQHSEQHKSELQDQNPSMKSKYRCAKCGERFQMKEELNSHMESHLAEKVLSEDDDPNNVTIEVGGFVLKVCDQ